MNKCFIYLLIICLTQADKSFMPQNDDIQVKNNDDKIRISHQVSPQIVQAPGYYNITFLIYSEYKLSEVYAEINRANEVWNRDNQYREYQINEWSDKVFIPTGNPNEYTYTISKNLEECAPEGEYLLYKIKFQFEENYHTHEYNYPDVAFQVHTPNCDRSKNHLELLDVIWNTNYSFENSNQYYQLVVKTSSPIKTAVQSHRRFYIGDHIEEKVWRKDWFDQVFHETLDIKQKVYNRTESKFQTIYKRYHNVTLVTMNNQPAKYTWNSYWTIEQEQKPLAYRTRISYLVNEQGFTAEEKPYQYIYVLPPIPPKIIYQIDLKRDENYEYWFSLYEVAFYINKYLRELDPEELAHSTFNYQRKEQEKLKPYKSKPYQLHLGVEKQATIQKIIDTKLLDRIKEIKNYFIESIETEFDPENLNKLIDEAEYLKKESERYELQQL